MGIYLSMWYVSGIKIPVCKVRLLQQMPDSFKLPVLSHQLSFTLKAIHVRCSEVWMINTTCYLFTKQKQFICAWEPFVEIVESSLLHLVYLVPAVGLSFASMARSLWTSWMRSASPPIPAPAPAPAFGSPRRGIGDRGMVMAIDNGWPGTQRSNAAGKCIVANTTPKEYMSLA